MKRIAIWAFYGVGTLAIVYLALYAYAFAVNDAQVTKASCVRLLQIFFDH